MYHTNIKNDQRLSVRYKYDIPETKLASFIILRPSAVIYSVRNILLTSLLALTMSPVYASNDFYMNSLFTPSDSLLKAEAKGRIMIYDGLDIGTVEKAMDEQFDRIDNMMFIRIRHPVSDDEFVAENDGC